MLAVVEPKIRGFICTTAHPQGCAENVRQQISYVQQKKAVGSYETKSIGTTKPNLKVLVIGASTGYGLASRITAAFGLQAATIGVFFERPASANRSASAGWYNSAAFEDMAGQAGLYAKSINGDAFSSGIKEQVFDLIAKDFGGQVDLVIYSIAAPRRIDPQDPNKIYTSTLKPIGNNFVNKTLDVFAGKVHEVNLTPATEDEILATEKVMGGEDWYLWVAELKAKGLLAPDFTTVAYSYIGPELTYPIYYHGTIGKAKQHLEQTVERINQDLFNNTKQKALLSINKALVTQASSAIPVVPLYCSVLYKVMKKQGKHEGTIEQISRLFEAYLTKPEVLKTLQINKQAIRLDDLELDPAVQAEIAALWPQITTDNVAELTDLAGYRQEFSNLFGFAFDKQSVDYNQPVELEVLIKSLS